MTKRYLKTRRAVSLIFCVAPMMAVAQSSDRLPPLPTLSAATVPLTEKEAYGIHLAEQWKNHPDKPHRGNDGSVSYLYGATMPTLICSPLEVCAIKLQAGEVVNDVHSGDTARWRINPATSGTGAGSVTYVVVKPIDAGLQTDLFITTTKRSYIIKLVSAIGKSTPLLSFDYPEVMQSAWSSYHARVAAEAEAEKTRYDRDTLTGTAGLNIENLDFKYELSGDKPSWTPSRIYTDGLKTYIQFPAPFKTAFSSGAPTLVEIGKGGIFHSAPKKMINYRIEGDRYVVDQVLETAALISGVGRDEIKVKIEHKG